MTHIAACLLKYIGSMLDDKQYGPVSNMFVVVNNTNLSTEEIAPYVAIATAYGHTVELVTIQCDPHVAAARSLHVNTLSVLKGMHERLMSRKLPPFWKLIETKG